MPSMVRPARGPIQRPSAGDLEAVVGRQRGAQGAAGIAGSGLDPDVLEGAIAKHLAIRHAIQGDAAGKAEIFLTRFLSDRAGQPEHHLFGHRLDRGGQIHLALGDKLLRDVRGGPPKSSSKRLIGHGETGAIIEIALIQAEGAVFLQIDQIVVDQIGIFRLAIRREAHDLVFAGIDLEAGIIGKRGIEQAERVREMNFLQHGQIVALDRRQATWSPIRQRHRWSEQPRPRNGDGKKALAAWLW